MKQNGIAAVAEVRKKPEIEAVFGQERWEVAPSHRGLDGRLSAHLFKKGARAPEAEKLLKSDDSGIVLTAISRLLTAWCSAKSPARDTRAEEMKLAHDVFGAFWKEKSAACIGTRCKHEGGEIHIIAAATPVDGVRNFEMAANGSYILYISGSGEAFRQAHRLVEAVLKEIPAQEEIFMVS